MEGHSTQDQRPDPDALLASATREHRGRLKVFLGAAPGVGKTYAMLQAAQQRRREGADVVVGLAETHGRVETQALLQGLEVLARRKVDHRGTLLEEMDLDAVLARRPQLVLVDELAHTNAPESRHAKRYLDVEELIAAGIDVYATLNIQHLESLHDAVAQITGIQVRERLPDRILDQADEVQLIDLPPEELIQRLEEGKVYVPEQAARAIRNYFRAGNLNALRELALRRTADRVDDQMRDYMQAQAIPGPWPTTERIMVCVSPSPFSVRLVRAAKRRADRRNAQWLAVYIETPAHERLSETDKDRVSRTLRLAEQLGGEAVSVPGHRPAEDLIRYAQSRNVTEIIIGKSLRTWFQELLHGSIVNGLVRHSGRIDVHVISGEESAGDRQPLNPTTWQRESAWRRCSLTVLSVILTALIAKLIQLGLLRQDMNLPNLSMVFLLGVLFVAVRFGLWPSLFATALSALIYNFFFIQPLHTFAIASPQELLAFLAYLVVAVIVSNITARVREQADAARRREDRTSALFALSRAIAAAPDTQAVSQAVVQQVNRILHADAAIMLPEEGLLRVRAIEPATAEITEKDHAAASWAWQHSRPAGRGTDTLPGTAWSFVPLRTLSQTVGVLAIRFAESAAVISPRQWRLIESLADQAAVGIESARLRRETEQARVLTETEKLRAALLSSVSHDLRTPLASIIGSASSLLSYGREYDDATRNELLSTIQDEAERLNRFVGNLLDSTRLESGKLELKREWVEIDDLVGAALARMRGTLADHQTRVQIDPNLPLWRLDFVLMEQVLVNLLDNAAKYSPAGTTIAIAARQVGAALEIDVCDEGPGVPQADLERIFDKFHRVRHADRGTAGTGLGLSICRGMVEAHGGTIEATMPSAGKGLLVTIRLPVEHRPKDLDGEPTRHD